MNENKNASEERTNQFSMSFKEMSISYINNSNMNPNNLGSKSLHKGIFSKFNYLKKTKTSFFFFK